MPEFANPYDAVIADFESRRAQIDAAIQFMRNMRETMGTVLAVPIPGATMPMGASSASAADFDFGSIPSDAFYGLTIVDAAIKFLGMVRKPQPTNKIIDAFERGALKGKKYPTVYGVLNRRKEQVGDIVNVNGDWALAEWYGGGKTKSMQRVKLLSPEERRAARERSVGDAIPRRSGSGERGRRNRRINASGREHEE